MKKIINVSSRGRAEVKNGKVAGYKFEGYDIVGNPWFTDARFVPVETLEERRKKKRKERIEKLNNLDNLNNKDI